MSCPATHQAEPIATKDTEGMLLALAKHFYIRRFPPSKPTAADIEDLLREDDSRTRRGRKHRGGL